MNFKDLNEEQINKAREIYQNKELSWDERMKILMEFFGKSERTVRKWCSEKLGFKEKPDVESEQYQVAKQRKTNKEQKMFIITWAQNDTPVHKPFFENITAYAEYLNADIHVIAGRYKNPTSVFTDKDHEMWDNALVPYLDANRHDVHKYVSIMSDFKIQPTATNPMSGLQGVSGINSCVFGAPKVQLEMISVLEGNKPKMMLTTGAVTKMNYTDSKSGKKGEFHHTYGFAIVEIADDETFYVRQVTANDKTGDFTDLCYRVEKGEVTKIDTLSAIVFGDIHYGHHDQEVIDKTHEFLNKVKPEHVVLHDVFDGNSISHHEMKDPFIQFAKEVNDTNSVEKEINKMLDGLESFKNYKNVKGFNTHTTKFVLINGGDQEDDPCVSGFHMYKGSEELLVRELDKFMSEQK